MADLTTEKTIGEIIAEARKNAGLSLRTVASKIPIHFTYLADIEKNRRLPSEKVLQGLSNQPELDLSFDNLMSISGRLGETTENYIKNNPNFGGFIRKVVNENFNSEEIEVFIQESLDLIPKIKNKK